MAAGKRELGFFSEEYVIDEIIAKYITPPSSTEYLGFHEDARDIFPISPRILFNVDGSSIRGLKLPWRTYRDVGYSAVAGAISDHVVKGSVPRDIMVSIGYDPRDGIENLEELIKGIADAVNEYKLRYLGGDTNKSSDPWISVAAIGYTSAKKPPTRSHGCPGDIVVVTGRYGAMGVVAIDGIDKAGKLEWVVKATKRPHINIRLAYIVATHYREINAAMDVSDGLGYTLLELATRSGIRIVLNQLPLYYDELHELCSDEKCLWRYVLNGGEEYGGVFLVRRTSAERFLRDLENYDIPYKIIGYAVEGEPGVVHEKLGLIDIYRWDQFSGWKKLR